MNDTCPRCGRPVALVRLSCLYCGAELEERLVAGAAASAAEASAAAAAPAPPERDVLVLDLREAAPGTLAGALGLTAYEAEQRARRGGYQLHRVLEPSAARAEAARLRAGGLRPVVVPEAEARAAALPWIALGGALEDGALALRSAEGPRRLAATDLALVVRGDIARALEPPGQFKRVRVAGPGDGLRLHLHLQADPRPVEIDPEDFECGAGPLPGSSAMTLRAWLGELAPAVPVDEGFRHLVPALAPALPPPSAGRAAGAAEALVPARPGSGERPALFDNVAQFRFYSGWRGAVERRAGRWRSGHGLAVG